MDTRTSRGFGSVARRASITVAVSAVLMTGLHYAPLRGFSPGRILFGHEPEMAALPASPATQPNIRFVGIPASEAFATAAQSGPATAEMEGPAEPAAATVVPTPRPAFVVADTAPPTGRVSEKRTAAILVRPTARPVETVRMTARPSAEEMDMVAPALPELQYADESVPEPAAPERGLQLADLVPSRHGVLNGVVFVGRSVGHGARSAVTEIADGAMAIVGR